MGFFFTTLDISLAAITPIQGKINDESLQEIVSILFFDIRGLFVIVKHSINELPEALFILVLCVSA